MQSDYAGRISEYISNYEKNEVGSWPLEFRGEIKQLSTYQIPISYLRYNIANGRIAMEVLEIEKNQLKRPIDTSLQEDETIIRELLLSLDSGKTEELIRDLKRIGQEQPGVITHDGIVINGNRRMAIFQHIHKNEDSSGKWERLKVIRLPENISEKELWKLEAGLQLSQRKVADYHPVNELLKIKQGLKVGLNAKEMVDVLYGRSQKEIEEGIGRLKLIDNFLKFMDQPENYGLIKKFGYHEYFINIQKNIMKDHGSIQPKEQQSRLSRAYSLLRADIMTKDIDIKGITHMSIRKLGKVYDSPKANVEFGTIFKDQDNIKDIPPEEVIEAFRRAEDVLELEDERKKPKKII